MFLFHVMEPWPVPSVNRQWISTRQVNLSRRLKVLYKYDRQLHLPEIVFCEEGTPSEQKSKMTDTDSDESQKVSFHYFRDRNASEVSNPILFMS